MLIAHLSGRTVVTEDVPTAPAVVLPDPQGELGQAAVALGHLEIKTFLEIGNTGQMGKMQDCRTISDMLLYEKCNNGVV